MYSNPHHKQDISNLSFLITGGGGFIGSNLVEYLLKYNAKKVRVLDNFSNGYRENLTEFMNNPTFELIEGDIRDLDTCKNAMEGMDYVSHQAALGSVPRSINDPATTNDVNITGFLNMMIALKDSKTVKRMVYAASSSTYGDSKSLPKVEDKIGNTGRFHVIKNRFGPDGLTFPAKINTNIGKIEIFESTTNQGKEVQQKLINRDNQTKPMLSARYDDLLSD